MMRVFRLLFLLLLLLPASLVGLAQSLENADSLRVGDSFYLRITSDVPIARVSIPDSLESFAVVGNSAASKDQRSWRVEIVALDTGALSFPKLQVFLANGNPEPAYTDGFRVYVLSVLAEGDTLLRDIKPLERYPLQLPFGIYLLLLLLALGMGIYLFISRPKKLEPPKAETLPIQPTITLPAWQEALEALDKLLATGYLEREAWQELYFGLSEVLRSFLEKQYHFAAMEMTVSEISQVLQHRSIKSSSEVLNLLQRCDLVKFAKFQPDIRSTTEQIQWLKSYLSSFGAAPAGVSHA